MATVYEPGRWWKVIAPDGTLWCETSNEDEARRSIRPGDELWREWVTRPKRKWMQEA